MLSDLTKYDLIDLMIAEDWPESKQVDLVAGFTSALSGYLAHQLDKYLDDNAMDDFEKLTKDPSFSQDKVQVFYASHIPDYENTFDAITLEFKRIFLLDFYERMVKSFEKDVDNFKNGTQNGEATKDRNHELGLWQNVYKSANNNEWERVYSTLQQIPH